MYTLLSVAAGGAIGCAARHGMNVAAARWIGTGFPWGTLAVNILGSFILGALVEWLALRADMSQHWRSFVGTGFCGGLTTFSAYCSEIVLLAERQQFALAAGYAVGSVVVGVGAFVAGIYLLRAVL